MEHLPEFVFINVANMTLSRRDKYLAHVKAGIKQETLSTLRQAPLHLQILFPDHLLKKADLNLPLPTKKNFYCVNTSYPMDNLLNRSAQTGPPNARKRHPVFPPAGRSVILCTPQMAPRTSFLSRQPDIIASFSFGAFTVQTCFQHLQIF